LYHIFQFGIFDYSTPDLKLGVGVNDAEAEATDSDLEAELAALTGGGAPKPKRPPRKKIPDADLDAMVAESIKDIPSDEELSGDDDDPDLLNELSNITGYYLLLYEITMILNPYTIIMEISTSKLKPADNYVLQFI
jgi:hypothetical protein